MQHDLHPSRAARWGPCLAGALLLAALVAAPSTASAKGAVSPVSIHLESLTVGKAREFRLAVVHPLFAPKFASDSHDLSVAAGSNPDKVGVRNQRSRVEFLNFGDERLLMIPGEVVRTASADYALRRHAVSEPKGI